MALRQVGDGDERVRAEQLVEKRLRTMHGLSPEVQSRRLAGLLARKGYSGEIAWPVIRDAMDGRRSTAETDRPASSIGSRSARNMAGERMTKGRGAVAPRPFVRAGCR